MKWKKKHSFYILLHGAWCRDPVVFTKMWEISCYSAGFSPRWVVVEMLLRDALHCFTPPLYFTTHTSGSQPNTPIDMNPMKCTPEEPTKSKYACAMPTILNGTLEPTFWPARIVESWVKTETRKRMNISLPYPNSDISWYIASLYSYVKEHYKPSLSFMCIVILPCENIA